MFMGSKCCFNYKKGKQGENLTIVCSKHLRDREGEKNEIFILILIYIRISSRIIILGFFEGESLISYSLFSNGETIC